MTNVAVRGVPETFAKRGAARLRGMKRILDPTFRYVPSHETDLRKTFERLRREREVVQRKPIDTVVLINREKKSA